MGVFLLHLSSLGKSWCAVLSKKNYSIGAAQIISLFWLNSSLLFWGVIGIVALSLAFFCSSVVLRKKASFGMRLAPDRDKHQGLNRMEKAAKWVWKDGAACQADKSLIWVQVDRTIFVNGRGDPMLWVYQKRCSRPGAFQHSYLKTSLYYDKPFRVSTQGAVGLVSRKCLKRADGALFFAKKGCILLKLALFSCSLSEGGEKKELVGLVGVFTSATILERVYAQKASFFKRVFKGDFDSMLFQDLGTYRCLNDASSKGQLTIQKCGRSVAEWFKMVSGTFFEGSKVMVMFPGARGFEESRSLLGGSGQSTLVSQFYSFLETPFITHRQEVSKVVPGQTPFLYFTVFSLVRVKKTFSLILMQNFCKRWNPGLLLNLGERDSTNILV